MWAATLYTIIERSGFSIALILLWLFSAGLDTPLRT
jgi:hypothetical protein